MGFGGFWWVFGIFEILGLLGFRVNALSVAFV